MRAAVITGERRLELIEVPEPRPTLDGVVVAIAHCGICGTDVHAYQSGRPYRVSICGHEWAGTIAAVGAGVRGVSEGDQVVVAVPPPCGACAACRAGQAGHCDAVFRSAMGFDIEDARHGGFAPLLAVPAGRVVKAHPGLSPVEAAQIEPATVTFHAVRRSGVGLGDTVVVQGAGPIGLTTLQWARAAGAAELIVVEPNDERRRLAGELGATHTVTPDDALPVVLDRTGGLGADVVYECVGRSFAVQSAVDLTRRGGRMSMIGVDVGTAEITPRVWLVKEIAVVASLAYSHEEFDLVMAMVADGRVRLEPLHSHTVGLDGLDRALAGLAAGAPGVVKVLVDPDR